MKPDIRWLAQRLFHTGLALAGLFGAPVSAQVPAAATDSAADSADAGWPRELKSGSTTFSVYQPQVDSWNGDRLATRAAVAVLDTGATEPTFGVIWLSARTDVDKTSRLVALENLEITKTSFPSSPEKANEWRAALQRVLPETCRTIALDRLESELAVQQEVARGSAAPLRNNPPHIIFSTRPAILVLIDGQPVLRPAGNGVERVINTRPLLLRDGDRFYLHVFDGWMQASTLTGPWSVTKTSAALAAAMQSAVAANQVDLLNGVSADSTAPAPSLASGPVPDIYVSTEPAELVVTDGAPDYVPVDGTQLLYVDNTTGRVFKSIADNETYLLISGRWYRAPSTQGPWTFVPGKELPADFARIPDSSAMENVKASVPGTPQAQEAAIANSIPQTATVKRAGTTLDPAPKLDGDPQFQSIEGTRLRYVLNGSIPIIQTGPSAFYAVQNGVWFGASSVRGPWVVAASVPAAIYSIPPTSPLYYVTFVQVYGATPDVVYVGYTPGYYGTVLDPDGIVVYGTGYYYPPWIDTYWFGFPRTYGFGADLRWTPWTGWSFGFGFGWNWGPGLRMAWGGWGWGPHPWWGPSAWLWAPHFHGYARGGAWFGRGGWGGTSADVYARWGGAHVINRAPFRSEVWTGGLARRGLGVAYNSHTGFIAAGQRVPVRNIYNFSPRNVNRTTINRTAINRTNMSPTNIERGSAAQRGEFGGRAPIEPGARAAPRPTMSAPAPNFGSRAPSEPGARVAPRPTVSAPAPNFGSPSRAAGDLYAGPRGQVFRPSPTGGWQQHAGGSWRPVAPNSGVDRELGARRMGEQRTQALRSMGGFHGGFGGMRGNFGGMHGGRR